MDNKSITLMKDASFDVGKIGGTNMKDLVEFSKLAGKHLSNSGNRNALVLSAFGGVTDALIKAMDHVISERSREPDTLVAAFEEVETLLQEQIAKNPLTDGRKPNSRPKVEEAVQQLMAENKKLITAFESSNLRVTNDKALLIRDRIIGSGEDIVGIVASSHLMANEIPAHYMGPIDASNFERGMHEGIQSSVTESIRGLDESTLDEILIFGGHIRGLPGGITEAIGRSYSDTTAVDVAKALEFANHRVNGVTFWKDVDGLMTANPEDLHERSRAIMLSDISHFEALEAARSGSSLLQVQALELAQKYRVNLVLKNMKNPNSEGTTYGVNEIRTGHPFKTIVSKDHDMLQLGIVEVAGESGVHEYLGRVLGAQKISTNDTGTEGNTMCYSVPLPEDEQDRQALRQKIRTVQSELSSVEINGQRRDIECKWSQNSIGNISLVGVELANQKGLLMSAAAVLSAHGINILQPSHTPEQARVSLYVAKNEQKRALQLLHMFFFDKDEAVHERTRRGAAEILAGYAES